MGKALINAYSGGREPLFHLDLYRLSGPAEVREAGLEEYLIRPEGISLVEWIGRWLPEMATVDPGFHRISIRILDEQTREITHDHPGT